MKSGSLNFLEPSGPAQACYGRTLLLLFPPQRTAENLNNNDDDCGDPYLGGVKRWNWIHKSTFQKCPCALPLAANCRKPELTLSISIISPRMGNPPQRARQIDVAGPSASTLLVTYANEENLRSVHSQHRTSVALQHSVNLNGRYCSDRPNLSSSVYYVQT